jgi:von Willebrand factor type A domain
VDNEHYIVKNSICGRKKMKTYKSKVRLGNSEKTVVAINYTGEEQVQEGVTVDRLHFIHLLDRSGSMHSHLPRLMDEVDETLEYMSDNDLISVVWFSGEGQYKTVFKGKSKRDRDDIKVLLNSLKNSVGLTCFSEALKEADDIVEDLQALCPNFAVTLFTDGQPVVSSYDAEMKAIWANLDKLKERVMAVNTIGYGHWYNKELLEQIAATTPFGRFIHSSQIAEYSDIFSHNYEILSNMVVERVEVSSSVPSEILYLTSKNTKYAADELRLDFLNKTKNQFFFIMDDESGTIKVNDTEIVVADITAKINSASLNNLYYSLAFEYYYAGKADDSLDVMAHTIRDKAFVDRHINAFTVDERQEYQDAVEKAIFSNKLRLSEGEAPEGYVPADDAFCVMDLLKLLSNDNNYYIPLSSKEYNRIGLKVTDNFNLFRADDKKKVLAPMNEYVFNQKHLNISVKYRVDGTVKLNPIDAKNVGLDKEVDSQIYRTQTIIKDGHLNIENIRVRVSAPTYSDLMVLHGEGKLSIPEIAKEVNAVYAEGTTDIEFVDVLFDLTALPIINRMYAKQSTPENILDSIITLNTLKAKQKVFNYYIGKLQEKTYANKKTESFTEFTADQIRVLESHGLSSKLDYRGIDNEKKEKSEDDFYESRLLEFALKGWSSLPKVDDVIDGKKKNAPAEVMKNAITLAVTVMNADSTDKEKLENLGGLLDAVKKGILKTTIDLNTQKIAKVVTGGWWEGLEVNKKNDYEFTKDGNTLIIKNDMVKVYF